MCLMRCLVKLVFVLYVSVSDGQEQIKLNWETLQRQAQLINLDYKMLTFRNSLFLSPVSGNDSPLPRSNVSDLHRKLIGDDVTCVDESDLI